MLQNYIPNWGEGVVILEVGERGVMIGEGGLSRVDVRNSMQDTSESDTSRRLEVS